MATGIISLLNSFGVEMSKFTSNGVYGLTILAIFAGFWIVLYHFMSKKGENKTPMSKGLPPIISFILTISLIADISGGSVGLKSHQEFLKMFLGFFGFVLTIAFSGLLIWIGVITNKKWKNNWTHLLLAAIIFISTNMLLVHFEPKLVAGFVSVSNGTGHFAFYLEESYIGKTFGESLKVIGDILSFVNSISLFAMLWFLFKGLGSFGMSGASKGLKWVDNVRSERKENIKTLNDATRRVDTLLNQGSLIYKKFSEIVKDKKEVNSQTSQELKTWKNIMIQLDSELSNLKNVKLDKVNYKVDSFIGNRASHEEAEKINLGVVNLEQISATMKTQIDSVITKITNNDTSTIYSDLYNVAMGWYNFAKNYGNVSTDVRIIVDTYKMDLEIAEKLSQRERNLESLELKHINDSKLKKDFKFAVRKSIDELFSEKNRYNKARQLKVTEAIFKEISEFVNDETYSQLKELNFNKSKENNLFVHLYEFIWSGFEAEYVKGEKVQSEEEFNSFVQRYCGPNQIRDLLLKQLNSAGTKIKNDAIKAEAKDLNGFINQLGIFKEKLDHFTHQLKLITEVKNIKDFIRNNDIKFDDVLGIIEKLLQYDLSLLKKTEFKDNKNLNNYIRDLDKNLPAIRIVVSNLNVTYSQIKATRLDYPDEINEAKSKLIEQLNKFVEVINSTNKINQLVIDAINENN